MYQEQLRKPDHPLAYASARIDRASDHLATLAQRLILRGQQQIDGMELSPSQTDPNQIVLDPRADLGLDPMFGILVGEICYNLRGVACLTISSVLIAIARRGLLSSRFCSQAR
jgi:hypothetical protein